MHRTIAPIEAALPPDLDACFDVLTATDPDAPFALFGGAPRDADYAAHHSENRPVNDYDLRVWLPEDQHDERIREYVARLGSITRTQVAEVPSAGTGRIRYCLNYRGADMDISIRPPVVAAIPFAIAQVAIERASDADIGLSSIAIAPDKTVWTTAEYTQDRNNRTLSVYPRANAERRLREYTERMQAKFPNHKVIRLW